MPDDERTRRRVSDETKGRIDNLASGWTVDPDPPAPEPPKPAARPPAPDPVKPPARAATPANSLPTPARPPTLEPVEQPAPQPRRKAKTIPPPPPGSQARKDLENEILSTKDPDAPATNLPRAKPSTSPPPVPVGAHSPTTSPPPIPSNKSGSVTAMPSNAPSAPPYTGPVTRAARAVEEIADASNSDLLVPRGEFGGDNPTFLDKDDGVAHAQETIKRDPAGAILGMPAPAPERSDSTGVDPSTSKFERGDPTQIGRDDPSLASPGRAKVGRLRTIAALRRQRGILGDVRYVATAMFGVRRSRRELAELEAKQETRQQERRRNIITLGRTAVVTEGLVNPALGPARDRMGEVEDERARHHAQVVAADQELQRVARDREAAGKQHIIDLATLDGELAEYAKRLEPLEKERAQATRRGADLRDALRRIDEKIKETTASLVAVKGPKKDPAEIQAELATLKADREGTKKDEPRIAAELDALNPRIAGYEAKRTEATQRRVEMIKHEEDDQRRSEELLAAIGAKRKVMDRAANDAEVLRDKILFELGERLYVDRPADLAPQLAPIDTIDMELGSADRRLMELREILDSIDRWKITRGIAVIVLALAAVGTFVGWLIYMLA